VIPFVVSRKCKIVRIRDKGLASNLILTWTFLTSMGKEKQFSAICNSSFYSLFSIF
jgi:hypothetical protein